MRQAMTVAILALAALTTFGCASFNDTVVVDVGDQFRLLQADVADAGANGRVTEAPAGFECEFSARTTNTGPFASEREVNGTLRCLRIRADDKPCAEPAGQ
jgi:hypothetical protein